MRNTLLGLLLGALIFGVAFAGAKVATVTNPMSADLDGGGRNITNVNSMEAGSVGVDNGEQASSLFPAGLNLADFSASNYTVVDVLVGAANPSITGRLAGRGSLYLRDTGTTGEEWIKTGPNATDWQRVALAP